MKGGGRRTGQGGEEVAQWLRRAHMREREREICNCLRGKMVIAIHGLAVLEPLQSNRRCIEWHIGK